MWKHLVFAGLVLVVGCSGGNDGGSSGSSGGSGSTAGSSGGSTGGGSQTLTMTGPYSYSGPVTSTGYAVTGGSHTQVDVRVQVGADGVLHAIKTGSRIPVVVALSAGNVTHTDTVYVTVTNKATPPVLAGGSPSAPGTPALLGA